MINGRSKRALRSSLTSDVWRSGIPEELWVVRVLRGVVLKVLDAGAPTVARADRGTQQGRIEKAKGRRGRTARYLYRKAQPLKVFTRRESGKTVGKGFVGNYYEGRDSREWMNPSTMNAAILVAQRVTLYFWSDRLRCLS